MARAKFKKVYGVGINDSSEPTCIVLNGERVRNPYYDKWVGMLSRCYSKKYHARSRKYEDCSVCEEWLTFSNFKSWMENQNWQGKELDKDVINKGNRVYCPESCAFVSSLVNRFVECRDSARGDFLIGVNFCKRYKKYRATCSNPFAKKREHLGYFSDEIEAHQAWKRRKHELSCHLSGLQEDIRVAKALKEMYAD